MSPLRRCGWDRGRPGADRPSDRARRHGLARAGWGPGRRSGAPQAARGGLSGKIAGPASTAVLRPSESLGAEPGQPLTHDLVGLEPGKLVLGPGTRAWALRPTHPFDPHRSLLYDWSHEHAVCTRLRARRNATVAPLPTIPERNRTCPSIRGFGFDPMNRGIAPWRWTAAAHTRRPALAPPAAQRSDLLYWARLTRPSAGRGP